MGEEKDGGPSRGGDPRVPVRGGGDEGEAGGDGFEFTAGLDGALAEAAEEDLADGQREGGAAGQENLSTSRCTVLDRERYSPPLPSRGETSWSMIR